jgi:hypothetical protein
MAWAQAMSVALVNDLRAWKEQRQIPHVAGMRPRLLQERSADSLVRAMLEAK